MAVFLVQFSGSAQTLGDDLAAIGGQLEDQGAVLVRSWDSGPDSPHFLVVSSDRTGLLEDVLRPHNEVVEGYAPLSLAGENEAGDELISSLLPVQTPGGLHHGLITAWVGGRIDYCEACGRPHPPGVHVRAAG